MSEVKRYEDEMCGHGGCDMCSYEIVEDENGSWVDYDDYKKLEEENRELERQNRINGNNIKQLQRALREIKELSSGFYPIDSEEAYRAMYVGKECYAAFFDDWILIESLTLNKFMLEINGPKSEGGFIIYVGELSDYLFREKKEQGDD